MTNYFDPVSAKDTALSIAANEISAQEAVDACASTVSSSMVVGSGMCQLRRSSVTTRMVWWHRKWPRWERNCG